MDILIIVLAVLAIAHFIYESIIAPSLRMQCRNELFELRDRLRKLRIKRDPECTDEAFQIIHSGINAYLNRLSGVTIHFMQRFRHRMRVKEYSETVERRRAVIDACKSQELHKVERKAANVIEKAFFINSGAWAFYIVPVAIVLACIHSLTRAALKLVALPAERTDRLMPQELRAA